MLKILVLKGFILLYWFLDKAWIDLTHVAVPNPTFTLKILHLEILGIAIDFG